MRKRHYGLSFGLLAGGLLVILLGLPGCASPDQAQTASDQYYAQTSVGVPTVPRVTCVPVTWSPQMQCFRGSVPASLANTQPAQGILPAPQASFGIYVAPICPSFITIAAFGTPVPYGCPLPYYGYGGIQAYIRIGGGRHHHH